MHAEFPARFGVIVILGFRILWIPLPSFHGAPFITTPCAGYGYVMWAMYDCVVAAAGAA